MKVNYFIMFIVLQFSALALFFIYPLPSNANATTPSTNVTITNTPIKHLIVIFQENISFDHYFGIYPNALNNDGDTPFYALANTPSINGLSEFHLKNNTNLVNPFRMDKQDAKIVASCDNNHTYTAIQNSYHGGLLDKFIESNGIARERCSPNQVMGFFDGNTVTALWNCSTFCNE